MKHIYTLLILLFSAAVLAAAPIDNLIVNNGNWNAPPSWSLNRVPVSGDTVVIPAGLTVVVGTTPNYTASTLYIKVNGTLSLLQTANLKLGVNSIIKVNSGGTVSGDQSDNDVLNATIYIGAVKKFSDAVGKVNGPLAASSLSGTAPSGFGSISILPVLFMDFTAIRNSDNTVGLVWTTAEEINDEHYMVERSTNSADWNEIATILPGNNADINSYNYTDKNITPAITYYRIKQMDIDGKFIYSDTKVIKGEAANNTTSIFSANKNITIRLASDVKNKVEVRLISMSGVMLEQQSFDNASAFMTFSAGNVLSGIYVVQVVGNNGLIAAKKIVLN